MRPKTNIFKQSFAPDTMAYMGLYLYFVILVGVLSWMAFGPQTISYSYAGRTACITSPKFLPEFSVQKSDNFQLQRAKTIELFDYTLYSHTLCVSPQSAPAERKTYSAREALFGMTILGKPINVTTTSYARISPVLSPKTAVPVDKPLRFKLDMPDTTFLYTVKANGRSGNCQTENTELSCDISTLALEHDHTYTIAVSRTFKDKPVDQAISQTTKTLTPINIILSSISSGALVYDQPTQISLQTDKPVKDLANLVLVSKSTDGTETILDTKVLTKDKTITLTFAKPLPRKTNIELRLDTLHATDESGLSAAYRLDFTTSGGPKVTGTNIGKFSVSPSQTITVQFDQPLEPNQNFSKLAAIKINGQPIAAATSASGNRLIIDPVSDMTICGTISLSLVSDIQSNYLVSGDSAWNYTSRVRCSTIFSIGTSVKGRAIAAYRFGSGSNPIIYIGTIHGNETSAKTLMDNWLNELEANPDQIPAGRSIVVIPVTNPDGFAVNQRVNARTVDLNRNFPSNDWKAAVTVPGGNLLPTGGGTSALSEPESQALATYVQQQRPRVLLTFHAKASIIEANEAADSIAIANLYAKTSKYRAVAKSQNTIFNYDTTGALEDWMKDKLGLPALCIELSSQTGNEFSRNKAALWAIAKL